MLRGQAILHPPAKEDGKPVKGELWPMPEPELMRQEFARYEGDAFAGMPQARNGHYQAALAIYAAKSAEEGDSSAILDRRRWEESIRLATGGIDSYNGRRIVMPYGMDYAQFKTELYRHIDAIVDKVEFAATSYTLPHSGEVVTAPSPPRELEAARLKRMPLMSIGDGRYAFVAGDGILADKTGRPVIVNFNEPAPVLAPDAPPTAAELDIASRPATMKVRKK